MTEEYFELVCDEVPWEVVLTDPGDRVLEVVQVVRRLTGLSLWRSKELTARSPAVVLHEVPEETATAAALTLREAGAGAEARELG
ncbi:large subunit ribosomal protein L7/L12 [Streptomyces sp. DI166]|uniref:ribosomal protein L7/L12 n=1 Tax=Streptomyces sp. DI166 TaxID=1839783 RepID=UPI0007F38EDA|nr:ribosomal protein L7/L12 [Streptomyces sp. DI166]SBT94482.1 large subunit ribosomal protein L7/L12 [Streptomyces sp. DI166]